MAQIPGLRGHSSASNILPRRQDILQRVPVSWGERDNPSPQRVYNVAVLAAKCEECRLQQS